MSTQLDILALEPFYGGIRRIMLETLIRCSRHRWTLMKLPPRRIERRLATAAHWFSEQLSRHRVGRIDLLFTSEALNLADLFQLVPALSNKPSVVYFHSNQLPQPGVKTDGKVDFVNLNTATAASEIWFNSMFHLRSFLAEATAMIRALPEIAGQNPIQGIAGKAHLMAPPVDLTPVHMAANEDLPRRPRTFFVETRDANIHLLNAGLAGLARRGEKFQLVTVGPVEDLSKEFVHMTIPEADEISQARAMRQAELCISARPKATCDHIAIRALTAGCWPVFPASGVYPELLPKKLHSSCLYDGTHYGLTSCLQNYRHIEHPKDYEEEQKQILKQFDPIFACRAFDERLEELVVTHAVRD